ncbi:MAG: hypothetical protein QNJ55_16210 [Xenococcus sp. MO_188.B8]|nr:hypothetical protein [Xenococcus sp. MO_188.B8]
MFIDNFLNTSALVGIVFILTGIAKVIEPWKFTRYISDLKLLQPKLVRFSALAFTAIESALGVALILGVFPSVTIPACILLLMGLTVLTYWSTSTERAEDCGCYNGWLDITPTQSIILNLVYITLLISAFVWGNYQPTILWQWMLVLTTLVTSGALAFGFLKYWRENDRPYIDLTPLKIDRTWKPKWLGEDSDSTLMLGSKLVVFLSPQCSQCKKWLNVLKVVHYRDDLPGVIGTIALSTVEAGQDFVDEYGLNYPVIAIERKQQQKLGIDSFPTAILLEDGVIREKWLGVIPEQFVERIRQGDLSYPG